MNAPRLHGLLAEFSDPDQLRGAALRARHHAHYCAIEAYSPCPVDDLAEALDPRPGRIPMWTLLGGVLGGAATFALQWYSAVIDYPINVGGRTLFSWPAFVPAALEMTILWAALFAVGAMLIGSGLPRFHHPLFGVPAFDRASNDRFYLLLRADDPMFDVEHTHAFLQSLAPLSISEVRE